MIPHPGERTFYTYLTGWLGTKEGEKSGVREAKDTVATERYIVALPIARGLRKARAQEEYKERMKA